MPGILRVPDSIPSTQKKKVEGGEGRIGEGREEEERGEAKRREKKKNGKKNIVSYYMDKQAFLSANNRFKQEVNRHFKMRF